MYRTLDPDKIVASLVILEKRIDERFPQSGLGRVCAELNGIAKENKIRAERIGRPNVLLRAGVFLVIAGLLLLLSRVALLIDFTKTAADSVYTVLQGIEASMNILVLVGALAVFLVTCEDRLKRRRALAALHELRSIAHVIDMHQLTKDPSGIVGGGRDTPSSPHRALTPFLLTRYLDYCSEMLSLTAKVAALYAQNFPDPVVADAVNDLETITASLSQKIWQKINIVQALVAALPTTSVPAVARAKQSDLDPARLDADNLDENFAVRGRT